ncbi:alpha/beta hydrolase [Marinoscillum sp.]|uniref:alpha/beta hydrolase n=1 Tax=Marinoscillum sp. TaxID=2024838 RepID=UPI003BA9CFAD
MKRLLKILIFPLVLFFIYFFGPRPQFDELEAPNIELMDISLDSLDRYVKVKDLNIPDLKPGNESLIVWADSVRKTRYSVVYLHGFSASPMESNPTHLNFAKAFGFNIYLPLLAGHGRKSIESFADLQPNDLIRDAKEAIAIGQLIGEDVIVMSCSTGSTLAIYLAGENKELIDALIMYSPNIALKDPTAQLVTGPWGSQIIQWVVGPYWNPNAPDEDGDAQKYWTRTYRTEGLIALQSLLDQTMTPEVFKAITQPYFVGYYYKNETEQDGTISTEAIRSFVSQTATPELQRMVVTFPDAGEHVIANPLKGRSVQEVQDSTARFAEQILKLNPMM